MAEPFKNLAWDDFRLVKAIADARGLPGAAALLGINHSTMFRRLGQIEEALGAKLFERHRTGYALTTAGEEMVALAQRMDERHHRLHPQDGGTGARAGRRAARDHQRLAARPPAHAPVRRVPRASAPTCGSTSCSANQALNLSKRDADVAIRATDNPPENLVGRRVASIAWALYGRADEFPDPEAVDPASLYQRRLGLPRRQPRDAQGGAVRPASTSPPERIVYKVNTVLGLAEAVEAGLGIGHLPCFIADARPGLVAPRPARARLRGGPLAPHPSRPAPLGAGPGLPRLPGRGDRQAAQAHRGGGRSTRGPSGVTDPAATPRHEL